VAGAVGRSRRELVAVALRMARSLFFEKRSGGVHYRCGNCGVDQQIETGFPALKVARLVLQAGPDHIESIARGPSTNGVRGPAPAPLMLGAKLVALICPGCCPQTLREMEERAPRSYVDTDDRANLLGDF
jgi:hypothetical protein